jgi:DNA polymerase-3 subunit delta'
MIIGHAQQRLFFEHAIGNGQLSHAYILSGPEGVGKKLFALHVTRFLLCETGTPLFTECRCSQCLQVKNLSHPDLYMFCDKDSLKISNIRRLPEIVLSSSYSGRYKVIVMDNAHYLAQDSSDAAANALLKTLEEPGTDTVFFLVTHKLDRIPDTVISRSIVINFNPLEDEELLLICESLNIKADGSLLKYACGSVANLTAMAQFDFEGFKNAITNRDGEIIAHKLFSLADNKQAIQAILSTLHIDFINMYRANSDSEIMYFVQYLDKAKNELEHNINANVLLLDLFVRLTDCLNISTETDRFIK